MEIVITALGLLSAAIVATLKEKKNPVIVKK
jgi:hypothetical protein